MTRRAVVGVILAGLALLVVQAGADEYYYVDETVVDEPHVSWQDYVLLLFTMFNGLGAWLFLAPMHFPLKKQLVRQLGGKDAAPNRWANRCFAVQLPVLIYIFVANAGGHVPQHNEPPSPPPVIQLDADDVELPPSPPSPVVDTASVDEVDPDSDPLVCQRRYLLAIFNVGLLLVLRRLLGLLRKNFDQVWELEEAAQERDVVEFTPPPLALMTANVQPMIELFDPQVIGLDNVPDDGPCLLVGNHAVLGLDMPVLLHAVYKERGVYVRGLADHLHFSLPGWSDLIAFFGAVDGTPRNCSALLAAGRHVLVYPGGAAEVTDNKYNLLWKHRLGFVRQACQHAAAIVPVATVGTNEMLDVVHSLPIGWLLGRADDVRLPILKTNGTIQRIYYKFGAAIQPRDFFPDAQIDLDNHDALVRIRDSVKQQLEDLIAELQEHQANDQSRFYTQRRAVQSNEPK